MHTTLNCFILLASQWMIYSNIFSQPAADPQKFYRNVVDIGNGGYGTIVGDDDNYCYFICVKNLYDKKIDSTLERIRFYRSSFVSSAGFIKEFYFGIYQVLLYQCIKDPLNYWQKRYFGSVMQNTLTAFSFVNSEAEDSAWVMSSPQILLHNILKGGQVVMTVPQNLNVKRGMPLVSNNGFIAGIFAENGDSKTFVAAINMRDIAEVIYSFSNCWHFNMIEYKRHANRCALEQFENQVRSKKESHSPPEKFHFVNFGLFGNLMGPSTEPILYRTEPFKAGVSAANYGASLYLNIDRKNRQRITMKIGLSKYEETDQDGFWKSSDGKLKMTDSHYEILNQSFVYEWQFYTFKNFSGSLGLGYSLGLASEQNLSIRRSNVLDQWTHFKVQKSALLHRLVGEVHFFEWKILRLGVFFWKDFGKYPNANYSFSLDGTTYKPFENRKNLFYHGVESSIRLGGIWGRKRTED